MLSIMFQDSIGTKKSNGFPTLNYITNMISADVLRNSKGVRISYNRNI